MINTIVYMFSVQHASFNRFGSEGTQPDKDLFPYANQVWPSDHNALPIYLDRPFKDAGGSELQLVHCSLKMKPYRRYLLDQMMSPFLKTFSSPGLKLFHFSPLVRGRVATAYPR